MRSNTRHGQSGQRQGKGRKRLPASPTYRSWCRMLQRCTDPNYPDWYLYGARGITVCDKWRGSFEEFFADMGERPQGHFLDRIDNDGNYEPKNCRWVTIAQSGRNRRTGKLNETAAALIRQERSAGSSREYLANKYGVSVATISDVCQYRTWK